jgi:hypothetical protein
MRPVEAEWIRDRLLATDPQKCSPIANVGSSTHAFRTVNKPHIERLLFAPLRAAGFEVVHIDIKPDEGVDMVGDLTDPAFLAEVKARGCRSAICSNLLEHLSERQGVIDACGELVAEEGALVVTVPYSYPYHADPIDTLYRPDVEALAGEFPDLELVTGEILSDGTLMQEEFGKGTTNGLLYLPKAFLRILRFWKPAIALGQLHRLAWLVRPFKVTCAVFRRPGRPDFAGKAV